MSDESIKGPSSIIPSELKLNHEKEKNSDNEKREGEKKDKQKAEEVRDHFNDLRVMVEKANEQLGDDNVPFRFGIEQTGNDIIINIMKINEQGEAASIIKKNITHDSFIETARHILNGEGFLIDFIS